MQNINRILQTDPLVQLVQKENFVGWVYSIDYDRALVMTNDLWKANAKGIPHNCFLVAASFDPERFVQTPEADKEVVLLRVVGSTRLPQDDDLIRTKIDHFQQQTDIFSEDIERDYDDITRNQLQFSGLECRVLGTFFVNDSTLFLGSDLESFASATRLNVYRPRGMALQLIVNYVDPIRRQSAADEARQLGIQRPIEPFPIGTVRYTSTDRLHRSATEEKVIVSVQPSDFLARRTAVLGMTRTGKSNLVKQMVSVVKRVSVQSGVNIGQIIYDVNGEYANANMQDRGSISDVYPTETIRYRMIHTQGFEELQNNFYVQLNEGFRIIRQVVREKKKDSAADMATFLNTSLDKPDRTDQSSYKRWQVRVAAYKAMLYKAGFEAPQNHRVIFSANSHVIEAVNAAARNQTKNTTLTLPDPNRGMSLADAVEWFVYARSANRQSELRSSSGRAWLDQDTLAILNMLTNKNANDAYINGYRDLTDARKYHSPRRSQEVGDEIYNHLLNGKIVILDLSVGDPTLRERISQQIASDIFNKSMTTFVEGKLPPNIVVYIEEAHNLIGKDLDLTDTWPRLAKEGAKYRIALVYATQEVSSVHPNILANTENWFISHLNNDREIRELSRFYDFGDFGRSLLRAQDVGFTRVKTLSSPFVVPVQIDKFDPQQARTAGRASPWRQGRTNDNPNASQADLFGEAE